MENILWDGSPAGLFSMGAEASVLLAFSKKKKKSIESQIKCHTYTSSYCDMSKVNVMTEVYLEVAAHLITRVPKCLWART